MSPVSGVIGLVLGSIAITAFSVGGNSPANSVLEPGTKVASVAAKPHVVTVTAKDFTYDAPDVVPAGVTEFRLVNKGPSLHHVALLKLTGGKTVADLTAALAKPGKLPAWIKEMGGPNAAVPGSESNSTLTLTAGNYALICFVDLGGPPHFTKGMVRPLRVVAAKAPVSAEPKADLTMTLVDYNFKQSTPVKAGRRTIRVQNTALQHHEVQLVHLAPGASVDTFMNWLQTQKGPPPGKALGGVAGLEPGAHQFFTANFVPGNYALICFLPDAKDGKPHFMHGMTQQIIVK